MLIRDNAAACAFNYCREVCGTQHIAPLPVLRSTRRKKRDNTIHYYSCNARRLEEGGGGGENLSLSQPQFRVYCTFYNT
jgi:hypothetical protein